MLFKVSIILLPSHFFLLPRIMIYKSKTLYSHSKGRE